MNMKKTITRVVMTALSIAVLCGCNDYLTLYPKDIIIGKYFWKKKSDVDEMVAGAYKSMISGDTEQRALTWGLFRSDEVTLSETYTNTDLENIAAVNLLPSQSLCNWAKFYEVINRCNVVLNHAAEVLGIDPEFTEGDLEVARGQVLALRSLAYFYLVRAFRDVPLVKESYETDDQEMEIPQVAPNEVLQYCIEGLEEASTLVMKTGNENSWRDYGYFTRDAVNALLAEIHLWRGSVNHSAADYTKCVEYCDKVIDAKDEWFRAHDSERVNQRDNDDRYHLYPWESNGMNGNTNVLSAVFYNGNSRESILELQYDGTNNANSTLCNMLFRTGDNSKISQFMASQIFTQTSNDAAQTTSTKAYMSKNDYRYWNFLFDVENEESTEQNIRKYATPTVIGRQNMTEHGASFEKVAGTLRRTGNFDQNWIIFRLSDVMLMKAEALVELAQSDDDNNLKEAFDLVQAVNKRSMTETAKDTLKQGDYASQTLMEQLVLSERQRELCFEGKRWFDLMRFGYRHMTGVNMDITMAQMDEKYPELYGPMISLASRKYVTGAEMFIYKMKTEPYLYWPVYEEEMKVNSKLVQNPVFDEIKTVERN